MSVFFIGDPHLGHKNIAKFRPFVESCEMNTDLIVAEWRKQIHKRATVYVMGDIAFDDESLDLVTNLPGTKILIKGNHDDYTSTSAQLEVFKEIHGMLKYKGVWLTHCPIHPDELRGKPNVHGHVHMKPIMKRTWYGKNVCDPRYFNTCVDYRYMTSGKIFTTLDEIKTWRDSIK
jgi:calcineurin-like phosphoesterase family protein